MAWTDTGGGDHEGDDWTPDDSDTIAGVHYGIGTFTVTNGYTINIDPTKELEVYATTATITGTIDGNQDGTAGGAEGSETGVNAAGSGGGQGGMYDTVEPDRYVGGGGGGYGGAGGRGGWYDEDPATKGAGGAAFGDNSTPIISIGGGGGGGASLSGEGGNGGGSVLIAANTITVSGTITCNGQNGVSDGNGPGAGGGAGGGILLIGCTVTVSGTLSCNGGNGRTGAIGTDNRWVDGGGGGGGRVKIFYGKTLDTSGSTITVAGGSKGASGSTDAADGSVGTSTSMILGTCTSAIAFGQDFTIGAQNPSLIDKIILYVNTKNTSGDFTLTVYDDENKGVNYGDATATIAATGEATFTFDPWIRVPSGETQFYFEVVADGAGDVVFSVYIYSSHAGGNYFYQQVDISYCDAYYKLYSVDHVKGAIAYNTADTTVKCNLTNLMLIGAVHRINSDGTGTLQYIDDFTTNKYLGDYTALSGVTHDTTDDELDIADSGYISYTIDTKYPVTGIPTLTATINITAGTPTIKISSDNATYYDIDTAIVDNVSTSYPLDNATSLSLKGLTTFYLKLDCAGDGTNTCSVITMQLDVDTVTETAENPLINTGAANTFRLDQDSDSGLDCTLALIYEDRKWAS